MSLAILFHLLCAQHVSGINISIFRSLRLCWWITTSVVLFSVRCVLELLLRLIFAFNIFCRKLWPLWDNAEEYCIDGQATEDNMEHARFILDTYGYKHTLTIRNTYCFSTATMVARTASILRYTYIDGLAYSVWFSEYTAIISLNKKERGYLSSWNTHCPLWGTNWTT